MTAFLFSLSLTSSAAQSQISFDKKRIVNRCTEKQLYVLGGPKNDRLAAEFTVIMIPSERLELKAFAYGDKMMPALTYVVPPGIVVGKLRPLISFHPGFVPGEGARATDAREAHTALRAAGSFEWQTDVTCHSWLMESALHTPAKKITDAYTELLVSVL